MRREEAKVRSVNIPSTKDRFVPGLLVAAGLAAMVGASISGPTRALTWALAGSLLLVSLALLGKARFGAMPSEIPPDPRRRSLVRAMGVAAIGALPLSLLPRWMERAVAADSVGAILRRTRQWMMIIDLRRCDGCQSQGTPPQCTTACIEGHLVPEPMEWIEVYEEDLPGGGSRFVPAPCMQCQNPPCVNVCPVSATWSTPEGVVLIDQDRCIGCRICMAACPYDRRFFNWGTPPQPPEALLSVYSPEQQPPAVRGTVMKCDFCPEMARSGNLPFCVQACPNHAIYYGDIEEDLATNGVEVVNVRRFLDENDAFRWKEDLGTDPRVWYVPGHGELVGRDPYTKGRMPTRWPWVETVKGAVRWSR